MKSSRGLTSKLSPFALRFLNWLLVLTLILPWLVGVGQASTTIVVNSTEDIKKGNDGRCSLREAIIAANSDKQSGGKPGECVAGSGADTIILEARTYVLSRTDNGNEDAATTGDLDITGDLTIIVEGPGATIDANGITDRAFQILSGKVTIEGVTITKNGGVVAGDGGGIHNSGNLTLVNSTLSDNHTAARGGGIYNAGVLTLKSSTIGGKGTTVGERGNTARDGGGIANASSGSVTLNNSTISGNTATSDGGGIFNMGLLALHNSTIVYNSANNGGGVVNSDASGTVNFRNTIIAGNADVAGGDYPDIYDTLISQGYNLIGNLGIQSFTPSTGDQVGTSGSPIDPGLGPLADNGGDTWTHALLPHSKAIDAGDPRGCFGSGGPLTLDQRGQPRPTDGDFNGSFLCDIGAFEVGRKALVLLRAFPDPYDNGDPTVHGLLDGAGNEFLSDLNLQLFSNDICDPSDPGQPLTFTIPAGYEKTDENGYFIVDNVSVSGPVFVTAKATDPNGVPLQSNCVPFSAPNDSWPEAVELTLQPVGGNPRSAVVDDQFVDSLGQSRWYKFQVEPNSNLFITLSGVGGPDASLPADYDLTLYKDLQAAFDAITDPDSQDLVRLGAQYAGSSYSGSSYSGSSYSGSSYSGSSYSGSSYSGSSYSGSSYSGSSYSGSSYSGSSYSGSSYSGDAYSGSSYSGSSYSGSSYSGSSYSGSSYSDAVFGGSSYSEAYSDAQSRSLLAVSAIGGTAPESIFVRTWNNDEFYYVRVRSSNGEFSLDEPFRLEVRLEPGSCGDILPLSDQPPLQPAGNFKTLILTDLSRWDRIEGADDEKSELLNLLNNLAGHSEVGGTVVDVSDDLRVNFANSQADANPTCPYAKNLVAQAIKDIVDGYRTQPGSNLKYVVLVGGDAVIPFFRHPDFADLARESQYVPPVEDDTASQAALRLDYVLSDDDYVAKEEVLLTHSTFPLVDPNVAIGRLVETAAEINAVIDAFLNHTNNGVVQPQTSLVTGYDFLEDAANEIRDQLAAGTNSTPDTLIHPFDLPPTDPSAWTADDLRDALLGSQHDLVFLAGHFSGHSALAADYTTEIFAAEVANSTVDMQGSIIFSVGCHAGYNIVNQDEVPGVPRRPDWAQAFASKGATLIAGTGYQYGETVTKEYSERLYIEFSKKLRLATGGPVSIGHALNKAKLAYLTQIPQVRGLHQKALLEATIFGLPMLSVDMPNRLSSDSDARVIDPGSLIGFGTDPGLTLGLRYADLSVTSPLNVNTVQLLDVDTEQSVESQYLSGTDGVVTFPTEPFLPLELRNVTVPGTVLRGVGFRGGRYEDIFNILPLTGAPTTEAIALHLSWQTDYLHPIQTWNANYIGALIDGETRVLFTPAQHIAGDTVDGIRLSNRRQFSEMDFRLFYSNNVQDFEGHVPALSAPPSIIRVSAIPGDGEVTFRVIAVGDPAAGMQSVWVTWTDTGAGVWQSLDLTQRETDTTLWEGTLSLDGIDPSNIRYIVQAVNGFGRVSLATHFGRFFTPGVDATPDVETVLTLDDASNPSSGFFEDQVQFSAVLKTSDGQPLEGQTVQFRLGQALSAQGTTDSDGWVTVTFNLLSLPGDTKLYAAFEGTATYQASSDVADFRIEKQQPSITGLVDTTVVAGQDTGIVITLVDGKGDPLRERTVFFVVTDAGGGTVYSAAEITDLFGQVSLGIVPLPPGTYTVTAFYNGSPLNIQLSSDAYKSDQEAATLTIVESPCETAFAVLHDPDDPTLSPKSIWEPNGKFWTVDVDVIDPSGQVSITINSVFQDEAVGNDGPDARFISGDADSVELRAERDGAGDGRVYHLFFTADDGEGFTCTGEVLVPVVAHDQSGEIIGDPSDYDDGANFDSTVAPKIDPVANDDSVSTDEDSIVSSNVLGNDVPAGPHDVLTVVAVNGDVGAVGNPLTLASGAEVTLNADGSFDYNPIGQFDDLAAGELISDTFEYTISDDDGDTDSATVIVEIAGVNDPPVADDDSATTVNDTAVTVAVLANDTDVDGDALTVYQFTQPISGTVAANNDGTLTYTPNPNFAGQDSFTYQASDGIEISNAATVIITVNSRPIAQNDLATTYEDTAIDINVLANDSDVDDDLDPSSATVISGPSNGTVTKNEDGTFTYAPNPGFNGADSFVYQICDTNRACDTATVTVTVVPVNDAPVAFDDVDITADEDTAVTIAVLANDIDADGDTLIVSSFSPPANGSVAANDDGTLTYTPNPNFAGQDSFTYQASDGIEVSNVATVMITVNEVNDLPVANPDVRGYPDNPNDPPLPKGEPVVIDVLANDEDADDPHDALTVVQFTQGRRGTVTTNDDGTLTYTPNSSFKGTDSFNYTISDGRGGTATATVTVTLGG